MSEQTKTRPDWTRREQCPLCKWWVASNLIQFHVCQSAGETPAPQEINKLQLEAENTRLRAALEAARERAIHAAGQVVARHPDHARVECLSICRIVDAALKGDPTGFRAAANGEPVCNGLLWPSDAELQDERLLEDVERIEECPEHPGLASLDLYIRSEHGIETNCYAFVRDGGLAGITTEWAGDCREVGLRCLGVVPFAEEE